MELPVAWDPCESTPEVAGALFATRSRRGGDNWNPMPSKELTHRPPFPEPGEERQRRCPAMYRHTPRAVISFHEEDSCT